MSIKNFIPKYNRLNLSKLHQHKSGVYSIDKRWALFVQTVKNRYKFKRDLCKKAFQRTGR